MLQLTRFPRRGPHPLDKPTPHARRTAFLKEWGRVKVLVLVVSARVREPSARG
jgi:hypothetical protein